MTPLITQEVAVNIAAHTQMAWQYGAPNDDAGEIIITCGLKPWYPEAEQRGGSTTIVDVKVGRIAYDIKCRDVLGIFLKEHSDKQKARAPGKEYHKINDTLFVSLPKSVVSPVRRPSVDLENYTGDCQRIMTEQIDEYRAYANRTVTEAGCDELRSVLLLYGEKNGYKAMYVEEQAFGTPTPDSYATGKGYHAYDSNNKLLYEILDYSKGSSNFNKRFDCTTGYLFVWPSQALGTQISTLETWEKMGNFALKL